MSEPSKETIAPKDVETLTISKDDVGKLEEQPGMGFDSLVSTKTPPTDEALVPGGQTGMAAPAEGEPHEMSTQSRTWTAAPKLEAKDLTYPRLRLGQGTTAEVQNESAKSGEYILTGYDPVASATVIPLMMAIARELRNKDDIRQIDCQSIDAVSGVGVPGGLCASCPKAEWGGPKGARKAPDCSLIYSYVCYSLTHESIVVVEFKKTGMPQAKFINTLIDNRGMGKFAVNLGSLKKSNAKQQIYFEPIVTMAKVDDEAFTKARASII